MIFTFNPKSEVLFGENSSAQAGARVKALGCSRVLFVYDKGVKDAGIVDPVVKSLEDAGLKVIHYGKVVADPPDTIVDECGAMARQEGIDGIVGVGGGSTLDTAKAVNVVLANPGPIVDYYFRPGAPPHRPGKPLVLIPTTAGTGSEVTQVAVITNTATGAKGGVKGPATIPTLAIVDPGLTTGLPPSITAATGMDTFAHALEAFTSGVNNNVMSDLLAEKAIELVARNLPQAVRQGSNIEVRTAMSFASVLAGLSFSDAPCHLGHAFGHALGNLHHVPHGVGCAIAQPAVIRLAAGVMPAKIRRVGELMGLKPAEDLTPEELGVQVAERIVAFNKEIGIPTLRDLQVKETDLLPLARGTARDICFNFCPVALSDVDLLGIVEREYAM